MQAFESSHQGIFVKDLHTQEYVSTKSSQFKVPKGSKGLEHYWRTLAHQATLRLCPSYPLIHPDALKDGVSSTTSARRDNGARRMVELFGFPCVQKAESKPFLIKTALSSKAT
ncbi:hypothetical protein HPP92_019546 [Vanilla planifolia]|uniref:Uncharacterized protein n=1 Tax=Vanilla planifolia TaxID=51239 RepID=A0A835UKV2_VANPL|nr:hypothetical protein HPP92_019546 [Vanilla planifolia]